MDEAQIDNSIREQPTPEPMPPMTVPVKAPARGRAGEKIRSELNIEKWPAIWQPAKSKNKPALRVMQREVSTPEGKVVSRVEVGYTQLGTLSTEEQKMLYVLIKLWEDSGKPDTQVFFSSRSLARMLKKKGWGTNVIDAITKSLRKLRTIPIEWINSYYDRTKEGAAVVDRRPLTLLGDLRIVERRQDGAVNSSQGYFRFDDNVLSNLQLNYTKPVCIDEFFKLHSEIAQLIYSHVDLMLSDKNRYRYERRSRELFEDLGLKNAEYSHMFERKRAIERALKELQGIRLSTGVLKSATLEKTVDGKDYKVVFSKSAAASLASPAEAETNAAAEIVINNFAKIKDLIVVEAEGLVGEFYRVFHGVETHYAQTKETDQALSLITQHGSEKARHVVAYARSVTKESNYTPQTFGGILSFTSRAIADFDTKSKEPLQPAPRTVAPTAPTNQLVTVETGEARLKILTPEQYAVRFAQAKDDMLTQFPAIGKAGSVLDKLIRSRMIRQLEHEPMDLMIPDPFAGSPSPAQNLPL